VTRNVVVIASAKGSPGVTTIALALSARWSERQEDVVLVEADPAGGDLSAWLGTSDTPGLLEVAASSRLGSTRDHLVLGGQPLPNGVTLVPAPAAAAQCRAALDMLNQYDSRLMLRGPVTSTGVAFVDVGRLDPSTQQLVEIADVVLIVCRGGVDSLSHAAAEVELLRPKHHWLGLITVGPCPFPVGEIARTLGLGWVHRLPSEPSSTPRALSLALRPGRRQRRSGWLTSIDALLGDLQRRLDLRTSEVVAPGLSADPAPVTASREGGAAWDP
jgi:hypothetical protein